MTSPNPLCVDLDGTLVSTDTLWESMALLLHKKPLTALQIPLWVLKGKSYCKRRVADHVRPDASLLPYREDLLAYLREEKESGRKIILASAADQRIVQDVAEHLDIFDAAHGSSEGNNLGGSNKAALLKEQYATYDYIGDCARDLPIWKDCDQKLLAGNKRSLASGFTFSKEFGDSHSTVKSIIKLMRPHQWLKNMLIFLPMLLAFKITDADLWILGVLSFACFSLIASVVYIINDSLDIENDRRHPKKKKRPIAASKVSIPTAIVLATFLAVVSLSASVFLTANFKLLYVLLGYLAMTSLYTFYCKRVVILDVLFLAGLFTFRIIGGAVVLDITLTPWLLAFSMFLFSSLAMVKRWIDLLHLEASGKTESSGRGYQVDDRSVLLHMGSAAAMCTVLVFSLFVNEKSIETPAVYMYPQVLWMLCPLLMYWLMRIWFLASRGLVSEDPVMFAAKDKVTYIILILSVVLVVAAKGNIL